MWLVLFFFQAEDGIRDLVRSRGLGDVYKRQVLMTTDAVIAKKIDKAVFPGEQGGPHVNVFAGLALTFNLAQTKQFKQLQAQTIKNLSLIHI